MKEAAARRWDMLFYEPSLESEKEGGEELQSEHVERWPRLSSIVRKMKKNADAEVEC